jgi:hypothetical protein
MKGASRLRIRNKFNSAALLFPASSHYIEVYDKNYENGTANPVLCITTPSAILAS